MSNDIRERLHEAVGNVDGDPDVHAAIRRGNGLRRRRRLGVGATAVTVTAIAAVVATTVTGELPPSDGPVISETDPTDPSTHDADPLADRLALFETPRPDDERPTTFGTGARPGTGVQYPTPRLQEPGSGGDDHQFSSSFFERARLAATHDDLARDLERPLEVYLVPHTGEPVDPDGTALDGDWIHVYLTGPGYNLWGSAPIPEPGEAAWAGSMPIGGQLVGMIVVGDGLDTAHSDHGDLPIDNNVLVLNDFGHDSTVTLSGPAGEYTLTTPPA